MMSDFLTNFPASWGFIGFLLASGVYVVANRYIFAWTREATANLRDTLIERVKSLKNERDEYRDKLHLERDAHNSTSLRCRELELRPDLSDVKCLIEQQSSVLKGIMESFEKHSREDSEVFQKIIGILDKIEKKT